MDEEERTFIKPVVEKRQYRRMALMVEVRCEAAGESEILVTRNLSANGLFISMPKPLAIGSEIAVSFRLPGGGPPVSCRARVANMIAGAGVGVEFQELDDASRQALEKFVDESR